MHPAIARPRNQRRSATRAELPEQAARRAMAWTLDARTFAVDAGFANPDAVQLGVLRSEAQQLLLLCTRQWGKSTVTAVLGLREVIVHSPALVLVFARAQRQAAEMLRKVRIGLAALGASAPGVINESVNAVELEGGSRIIALPGNEASIRGYSAPSLVIFDEAARVDDELYHAARPMLVQSRGRFVALSSAWGQSGWFYEEWQHGGPEWERVKVTAPECPRFDAQWLESERARVGARVFGREYLCEFGDTEETVFSTALVAAAMSADVVPLFRRCA
jgi:hypothetical protein